MSSAPQSRHEQRAHASPQIIVGAQARRTVIGRRTMGLRQRTKAESKSPRPGVQRMTAGRRQSKKSDTRPRAVSGPLRLAFHPPSVRSSPCAYSSLVTTDTSAACWCRYSAKPGHEVVGLDTGLFADWRARPGPGRGRDARASTSATSSRRRHRRVRDAVMHLAALCNDPLGNLNPDLTYDVNHRSTVRLARAAKAAGVQRFLFSSSCACTARAPTTPRWTRRPASRR